jgi:NitT/TauT family transport system substrate-binding protein
MKMIRYVFNVGLFLLTIISMVSCNNNKNETITDISFRFDWYSNMSFSGEIWAYTEALKDSTFNIELEPGSENLDPIKLILSGTNDFGIVSADKFLIALDKGADLVAIGVLNVNTPTVFISLKNKNIQGPSDFVNKTVGILPGGSTEFVYRTLLEVNNIDKSQIKEKIISFDLQTFIANQYDVRPAFYYDEPVFLESKGIAYNLIKPRDYGVDFLGRIYFTTRAMVENSPDKVQQFINAICAGWESAINNPEQAINNLKSFDKNTNTETELASFRRGIEYFKGDDNKMLYAYMSRWESTLLSLQQQNIIKTDIDLHNFINYSFLNKYHSR